MSHLVEKFPERCTEKKTTPLLSPLHPYRDADHSLVI